jgi:hypothetical protein
MIRRVLLWALALGVATAVAQTADGQIAGRIAGRSGGPLPGVQVTIRNGDQSRKVVTDSDGRFVLRSLTMGTYQVASLRHQARAS